ncbi:MAG: DUF1684 domain-containing protein [Terriglobia bacterium]
MRSWRNTFLVLVVFSLLLGGAHGQQATEEETYRAEITRWRQHKDLRFRTSPFSRLALVHREYLKERARVTLGSGPEADLRLAAPDIAPLHAVAVIEGSTLTPVLRAQGEAAIWSLNKPARRLHKLTLKDNTGFRIGRFNLLYKLNPMWGRTLEVFDPEHPALAAFTELDYFPIEPAYRIEAESIPSAQPERITLIDSHGNPQPYWLYGELRFSVQGTPCRLELYTLTLDPKEIATDGFMLIFTDATSGKESYPAARYLYVEGKTAGRITVDFNRAFSPPCNYSPVFTCPFPRLQNRLPVAIRAGEKWYRKKSGA